MASYVRTVTDLLKDAGFELSRHKHGSHAVWSKPERKPVVVSYHLDDRHLAQRVLKQAGLPAELIR